MLPLRRLLLLAALASGCSAIDRQIRDCDKGRAQACTQAAYAFENGRGVDVDEKRAVQLFSRACDGRNAFGCRRVAEATRCGGVVPRDEAKAREYLEKACVAGDGGACLEFARDAALGDDPAELERAASWLESVCSMELAAACLPPIELLLTRGFTSVHASQGWSQMITGACAAGNAMACESSASAAKELRDAGRAADFSMRACTLSPETSCGAPGGDASVEGLSPDEVSWTIRRAQPAFRACFSAQRRCSPSLTGRLVLHLEIGAAGIVAKAAIAESFPRSEEVQACVLAQAKRLHFPAPRGGGVVAVDYPLTFVPLAGE